MAAILDGKKIAATIKGEIALTVEAYKQQGIQPNLAVILAGDDPASKVYAKAKEKVCTKLGIRFSFFDYPGNVTENELLSRIDELNCDRSIHGILVELPLPQHISRLKVLERISPLKDVDGMGQWNKGCLVNGSEGLFAATPQACIEIMLRSGIEIAGKHAVIVGRGETVGKPLIFMLLKQNATVTVCHTKTLNLAEITRQADILVVACGRPAMIKGDMVKPGAVVVDAGINEIEGGICGDVDFAAVIEVAGAISPVPGGVGSLTTTLLLANLLKAIQLQKSI